MTIWHGGSYMTNYNEQIMENATLQNKSMNSLSLIKSQKNKQEAKFYSQHI